MRMLSRAAVVAGVAAASTLVGVGVASAAPAGGAPGVPQGTPGGLPVDLGCTVENASYNLLHLPEGLPHTFDHPGADLQNALKCVLPPLR